MGSGAQSSPAQPEDRKTVQPIDTHFRLPTSQRDSLRKQAIHKHAAFCVERYEDDFTLETQYSQRMLSPKYTGGNMTSVPLDFGVGRVKTPVGKDLAKSLSQLLIDGCGDGQSITPEASQNFDNLQEEYSPTQSPSFRSSRQRQSHGQRRISAASTSSRDSDDGYVWNLEADMAEHVKQQTIVGPNSVIDKAMLNRTLAFDPPTPGRHRMTKAKHNLSDIELSHIRGYVGTAHWQGNAYSPGMTVAISMGRTARRHSKMVENADESCTTDTESVDMDSGQDNEPNPYRMGAIVTAHLMEYDVQYLESSSAALSRSTNSQRTSTFRNIHSQTSDGSTNLSRTSTSQSLESKTSSGSQDFEAQFSESSTLGFSHEGYIDKNVPEHRIFELDQHRQGNAEYRKQALNHAVHVFEAARYALCDVNLIKNHQEQEFANANQTNQP